MTAIRLPLVSVSPLWRTAQLLGVVLTVALLAGLLVRPEISLHILWEMVIPLLPALFLVNPILWRNVCPLATLNDLGGRRRESPTPSTPLLVSGWVVGIVLLLLMVPARRVLFNEHGAILAATIGAVAALALVAGFFSSRRSGYCNALCPVLPVEKLYGQSPLLEVGNARCTDCNRCTGFGCIDLAGRRSAVQSVTGRGSRWAFSPFGLFACAFPGFVIGFFSTVNGSLAAAPGVFATVGLWTVASLALFTAITQLAQVRASLALPVLGGLSVGLYYWFAAPRIVTAYGGSDPMGIALRVVALALVLLWTQRAVRRTAFLAP